MLNDISDNGHVLCPMTFNIPPEEAFPATIRCIKENCAWWCVESQKCAMAVLAESVRKQVKR